MSESNAGTPPSQCDTPQPTFGFAERVAHLKAGYDNSQATVRFLDTKASAVIAVIPIVIAALAGIFGLAKDWVRWRDALASNHTYLMWVLVAVTSAGAITLVLLGKAAIWHAFNGITPRDTGKAKPSVIFPYAATYPLPTPDDSFASRVAFIKSDGKESDILEDYERQIVRMSEIVQSKINSVNVAVKFLKYFFALALVELALLCMTLGVGAFVV